MLRHDTKANGNTCHMLAAGMLATALAFSPVALPPSTAYAETGSVTITAKDNQDARYKVYQVFIADVEDGTGPAGAPDDRTATHISWKSDAVKQAALTYITANGYGTWLAGNGQSGAAAEQNPQNAAEYIGKMIRESATDTDAGTTPETKVGSSFANGLAQALAAAGLPAESASAGTPFTGEEGLYLFVSDPGTIGADESGSAAMWVPIGSGTTVIAEKTSTGETQKTVKEDSSDAYGRAADANSGQALSFRIASKLPDNIKAYAHYHWNVADQLPSGMQLNGGDTSSVTVSLGSEDITAHATIAYDSGVLEVDIPDLMALDTSAVAKGSSITVEYSAHLTNTSAIGSDGNTNQVTCTHTADPVSEAEVQDTPDDATVYTYQLHLVKVDKSNGKPLAGAKFTMQVASGNSNNPSVGSYVQQDGTLGNEPFEFTTGDDGAFTIPRIDEGTYTLHETAAPTSYDIEDADITVVIQSTLNQDTGNVDELTATVSGGEAATAPDIETHLESSNVSTGTVSITASDDRRIELPITGLGGNALFYLTAAGIAGASILVAIRRKKSHEDVAGK